MSYFSLFYLGIFSLIISILSFFNIIYSYYFNFYLNINTYVYTLIISLLLGVIFILLKRDNLKVTIFEKILIVILGYILLPLFISIPYYLSIYNISIIDAYFESISGFTSTGFTIFDNIKFLDPGLILWRSTSQWIGGLYFLFSIILLIDVFDSKLKKSITDFLSFNTSETLKQSFKVLILYTALTVVIFIIFKLINLRTFDAFNFSLTLISSGGFLPTNNIDLLFQNDISKFILSILMLLSFFSLFLIYNLIFFKKRNISYLSEDLNLLVYLMIIVFTVFVFFNKNNDFLNLLVSVASSVSNIGISFSDSYNDLYFLFFILVIIGGSFFSTSSGLRLIKIISLIKFSLNNLLSHTKPNQIYSNKVSLIDSNTDISDINKYFLSIIIFVLSLFLITILLTISNIDFDTSFKIGILTIMNTVNSNMYTLGEFDFYNLGFFTKIYLIIFMIIGRVELLTIMILFKKFLFKS